METRKGQTGWNPAQWAPNGTAPFSEGLQGSLFCRCCWIGGETEISAIPVFAGTLIRQSMTPAVGPKQLQSIAMLMPWRSCRVRILPVCLVLSMNIHPVLPISAKRLKRIENQRKPSNLHSATTFKPHSIPNLPFLPNFIDFLLAQSNRDLAIFFFIGTGRYRKPILTVQSRHWCRCRCPL